MRWIIITLVAAFFFLPFSSAADTEIVVKTLPGHDVFITILKPGSEFEQIKPPQKFMADYRGEVHYTFSDEQNSKFDFLVIVKYNGERKFSEEFETYSIGEPARVELLPEDYVEYAYESNETTSLETENVTAEESNETTALENPENITEETVEENDTSNVTITGGAISDLSISNLGRGFMKYVFYVIGAIVILSIILFAVVGIARRKRERYTPPAMKPFKFTRPPKSADLENIERKIQEIDKQIEEIKRDKLQSAERKLDERMKTLENLKNQR